MFYVVTTLSLRWIPVAASVGPSSIVIWIVGLLTIFIPLALCVMELSSRYPQEGGMYLWTKRAFGDFPAFLTGWIYWTSNLPYFPAVLYFAASNALYIGGTRWNAWQRSPLYFIGFSFFGVGLALALNVVGLNIGKWLNNIGSQGTWIPVALLCAVAVVAWVKFGSATSFSRGQHEALAEPRHVRRVGDVCSTPSAAPRPHRSWATRSRTRAAPFPAP